MLSPLLWFSAAAAPVPLAARMRQSHFTRPHFPLGAPVLVNTTFGLLSGTSSPVTLPGGASSYSARRQAPLPKVSTFLGIPYASPPTEALRWKEPMQWFEKYVGGLRPAIAFGNGCPQLGASGVALGEEDCLFLNVWVPTNATPAAAALLPILFFIHGGACVSGAGSYAMYDGSKLAIAQNVMVVTINYRLGPFGFLALQSDAQKRRSTGNWGLLDQRAAMAWVHREAQAFGGDPNRMAIFGESAGSLSVCLHLLMPNSWPYFTAAILESRSCKAITMDEAIGNATAPALTGSIGLANTSGCDAIATVFPLRNSSVTVAAMIEDCLRRVPSVALFAAAADAPGWGPVVDGVEIVTDPRALLAAGTYVRMKKG